MSYCRWSSDNWRCDLYCYEDVRGGWTTHVAGRRRVGEWPTSPLERLVNKEITPEQFAPLHNAYMDAVHAAPLVDIGLAHDGETFNDPTLEDFRSRLLMLRAAGYHFPDYVLEAIEEEIQEAQKVATE